MPGKGDVRNASRSDFSLSLSPVERKAANFVANAERGRGTPNHLEYEETERSSASLRVRENQRMPYADGRVVGAHDVFLRFFVWK